MHDVANDDGGWGGVVVVLCIHINGKKQPSISSV